MFTVPLTFFLNLNVFYVAKRGFRKITGFAEYMILCNNDSDFGLNFL